MGVDVGDEGMRDVISVDGEGEAESEARWPSIVRGSNRQQCLEVDV